MIYPKNIYGILMNMYFVPIEASLTSVVDFSKRIKNYTNLFPNETDVECTTAFSKVHPGRTRPLQRQIKQSLIVLILFICKRKSFQPILVLCKQLLL